MIYKFPDKKSIGFKSMSIQQLADKLYKSIIEKLKRTRVYSSYKDNIWSIDLADKQLISKYNKRINFFLCVIDLLSKYA